MVDRNDPWDVPNLDLAHGRTKVLPPKPDSKRDKWVQWLKVIDKDVTTLALNRMAYRAMTRIARSRQPQLPASFLLDYFNHTYVFTQAAGIRRQAEIGRDVASLARLLAEMADNPERIP